jgi:hypothetical protein
MSDAATFISTHAASICKSYIQYKIVYKEKQREKIKRNLDDILEAEELRKPWQEISSNDFYHG